MTEPAYKLFSARRQQGVLVLTLTGPEIQGDGTADALREELFAAVDREAATKVVLDFRNVTYISSAAFRPLLSLRRKFQDGGGRFVLCNLSEVVAEVFLVTRLVSTNRASTAPFEMEADVPAAIDRLQQPLTSSEGDHDSSGMTASVDPG